MKILVTGISGQLGHDVCETLCERGHEVYGCGTKAAYSGIAPLRCDGIQYRQLDITNEDDVKKVFNEVCPDTVIHCAAWTAVDNAEDEENKSLVYAVNETGTRFIASACAESGAKLMYISTDYVFDGSGDMPWKPESEEYAPVNVYGASKLAGETAVRERVDKAFILRISWVFGINGANFVKTMMRLSESHDTLRVVSDQIGRPTYTKDLSELMADMIETQRYGCYHVSNEGDFISWYDFACEIFRLTGATTKVIPVTTEEYGLSKAARPKNSRMDTSCIIRSGFKPLPDWKDALARYIEEL